MIDTKKNTEQGNEVASSDLLAAIERVCRDLPEDWSIELCMEKGSTNVFVFDGGGNRPEAFKDFYDDTVSLGCRILNALSVARAAANDQGDGRREKTPPRQ